MVNAVRKAAQNNNAGQTSTVNNNSGGRTVPSSPSGKSEEELLRGLGLDISILAPTKVRPTVTRGSAGKARKPLDVKTASALDQSLTALLNGEALYFPIARTNQGWTNDVQRTINHWSKDQRAKGVMVTTGAKDGEVPENYDGITYKVTQTKHEQSPNTKSPKAEDAAKVILYVIGLERETEEAEAEQNDNVPVAA